MSVIASKEKASVLYNWLCESIDHRLGLSEEEAMHVLIPIWYNAKTNTTVYPNKGINLFKANKSEILDKLEAGNLDYIEVAPGYVIPRVVHVEQPDNSILVCKCVAMTSIHSGLRHLDFIMKHCNNDFEYYVDVREQWPHGN